MSQFPFSFWKSGADLMSGADGALSLNGTILFIPAGSIKRYSSISIINNGELVIQGYDTYGTSNPGYLPTLIGCSGNCTINTGGKISAQDNAGALDDYYGDTDYSAPTVPFDSALTPITYTRFGGVGGFGGETGGWGTLYGTDVEYGSGPKPTGHGGGGAGYDDGGNTQDNSLWGISGEGGNTGNGNGRSGGVSSFGSNGTVGNGGEVGTGDSIGGGGSGGARGLSGGCVYLQVAGVANIDANSINVSGSNGGNGGDGGAASTPDGNEVGGGAGGGAAGGSGGYGIIRYKSGMGSSVSVSAVTVTGGTGGVSGAGGICSQMGISYADGYPGSDGPAGVDGASDIATY